MKSDENNRLGIFGRNLFEFRPNSVLWSTATSVFGTFTARLLLKSLNSETKVLSNDILMIEIPSKLIRYTVRQGMDNSSLLLNLDPTTRGTFNHAFGATVGKRSWNIILNSVQERKSNILVNDLLSEAPKNFMKYYVEKLINNEFKHNIAHKTKGFIDLNKLQTKFLFDASLTMLTTLTIRVIC